MSGGINFDTTSLGGGGNYGGWGGGYGGFGGIGLFGLLGLRGIGGFDDRVEKNCCPPPATCQDVNMVDRDVLTSSNSVDRDVLMSANETQEEICASTHLLEKDIWCSTDSIKTAVGVVGDKVTAGTYALNEKINNVAFQQERSDAETRNQMTRGFDEVKCLIKTTAMEQRNEAQEAIICAQNEEINRYKIIAALKHEGK